MEHYKSRSDLVSTLKGIGIELGVANGWFSDRILSLSNLTKLYSVDMWAGDRGHTLSQYKEAAELLNDHGERSVVIRAKFEEILPTFRNESLDFIYIDGYAHTGQDKGKTLESWWPKLKYGGIFSGHDYSKSRWPNTFNEVNSFLEKNKLELGGVTQDQDPTWYLEKKVTNFPEDILLIGNSPSALSSDRGKEIDDFKGLVVRFNDARTTGYEEKLGSRTDIWCTWGGCKTPNPDMAKAKRVLFSIPVKFSKTCKESWDLNHNLDRSAVSEESFYRAKHRIGHHPSSGAVVATHFIKNGHRVYIHGFSHFKNSEKHHYWPSGEKNKDHSGIKESSWFQKKIANSLIFQF